MSLEKIIDGCKKNDPASQRELYHFCFSQMMKVCLRYFQNDDDAAACYNASMYIVFVKINQFENKGEFLGWVRQIVVRTCLNEVKSLARFESQELQEVHNNSSYIQPEIYSDMQAQELLKLLRSLPASSAIVFNLYVMEGLAHQQIADELGISVGTSKWHLNNARTILKQRIKSLQQDEYARQ